MRVWDIPLVDPVEFQPYGYNARLKFYYTLPREHIVRFGLLLSVEVIFKTIY